MSLLKLISENSLHFNEVEDRLKQSVDHNIWLLLYFPVIIVNFTLLIEYGEGNISLSLIGGFLHIVSLYIPYFLKSLSEYVFERKIEEVNNSFQAPHKIIDDFLLWEEGDKIDTFHFSGYFQGVDDKKRVVLKTSTEKSFDGVEFACLPGSYFEEVGDSQNKTLQKRKSEKAKGKIIESIQQGSEYDELRKEFQKEYELLDSGK